MIVAAAIKALDGVVHSVEKPGRHHHVIDKMVNLNYPKPIKGTQGFLTIDGQFVDRVDGLAIAIRNHQIIRKTGNSSLLFSEDLW